MMRPQTNRLLFKKLTPELCDFICHYEVSRVISVSYHEIATLEDFLAMTGLSNINRNIAQFRFQIFHYLDDFKHLIRALKISQLLRRFSGTHLS